jgi:hypothetical protein
MELDESVLLGCFARAFGALDSTGKPDPSALGTLADRWFDYMEKMTLENEELRTQIRQFHNEMVLQEKIKASNTPAGQPNAGQPRQQQGVRRGGAGDDR